LQSKAECLVNSEDIRTVTIKTETTLGSLETQKASTVATREETVKRE